MLVMQDWTPIIVVAISSFATVIVGIITLFVTLAQGQKTRRQGEKTHDTFNSKMDAMLKLVAEASFAKGEKKERDSNIAAKAIADNASRTALIKSDAVKNAFIEGQNSEKKNSQTT